MHLMLKWCPRYFPTEIHARSCSLHVARQGPVSGACLGTVHTIVCSLPKNDSQSQSFHASLKSSPGPVFLLFFFPSTFFNAKSRELSFKQKCRRKAIWFPLKSVVPNNPVHYFTSDCLKMRPSHFSALIRAACHGLPGVLHSSHCGWGRWSHTLPSTSPGLSFQILFQRKCLDVRTKMIVFSLVLSLVSAKANIKGCRS